MEKQKKIGLFSLILMIFSAIYGFANGTVAYDQMGYASIIWYVLAALFFFLPSALMLAEYGSTFKEAKGGIYSWLAESIGEKMAFIGTFIWLSSWIIWMLSTSTKVWIPLSTLISGSDQTQTWGILGLSSTQTIGILGIVWILSVTFFATRGVSSIAKISSLGGIFVMGLTILFFIASILIWILNKGQLAEPVNGLHSFIASPNPQFQSPMALLSFVIYAVFAYAGMESMGGITDSMEKPEKTFPKGLIISTITITIAYSVSIFLWGVSANWHEVLGGGSVNLGNITYVLMNNLGLVMGHAMNLSHGTSVLIGNVLARLTGLSMFMAYLGSFFVLVYSPLKSFIMGSSPKLWPKKMTHLNKAGVPAYSMWIQATVVAVFIFFVSFGGSAAKEFYQILTNMANVSTSAPYLFLIGAFPFFKKRTDLERPFVVYKNKVFTNIIVGIVLLVLIAGIVFTCLQPIMAADYKTAFWTIIGPIFFGAVAWIFYHNAEKRSAKENDPASDEN